MSAVRKRAQERHREKVRQRNLLHQQDPAVVGTTCWASIKEKGPDGKVLIDEQTGEPVLKRCPNNPIKGQRTCVFHGGHSPNATAAGIELAQIQQARKSLAKLGVSVEGDPREILLKQLYAAHGMMLGAQQLVQSIPEAEAPFDEENEQAAQYAAYLDLYELWTERAAKIAKMCLDADIDERMVYLAENQAQAMVDTLKAVVIAEALGLTSEQRQEALKLLGEALRTYVPTPLGQPAVQVTGGVVPYQDGRGKLLTA